MGLPFSCYGSYSEDSPECRACRRSQACFVKTENLKEENGINVVRA